MEMAFSAKIASVLLVGRQDIYHKKIQYFDNALFFFIIKCGNIFVNVGKVVFEVLDYV